MRWYVNAALFLALIALAWQRCTVYESRSSYAQAVIDEVPLDVQAWNDLGLAHLEGGDIIATEKAWLRAIAIDPRHSKVWSNLGQHQLSAKRYEEAEETLRRAVKEGPRNPVAYCNLANVLLRQGRTNRAIAVYRKATWVAPGFLPAWRGLGNAQQRMGRNEMARTSLLRALELDPTDEGTLRLLERIDRQR